MESFSILVSALLLPMFAAGCATTNTVSAMPAESDAKVKVLRPPSKWDLVYVVRPTMLGKPFGDTITANGDFMATTQGHMYV